MIASTLALIARRNAALKRYVAKLRDGRADHHALREMAYRDAAKADREQADKLCAGADTFAPVNPKAVPAPKPTKAISPPVKPEPPRIVPPPPAAEAARFIAAAKAAPPRTIPWGNDE